MGVSKRVVCGCVQVYDGVLCKGQCVVWGCMHVYVSVSGWMRVSLIWLLYVDVFMVVSSVYRDVFKCMVVLCQHVLFVE